MYDVPEQLGPSHSHSYHQHPYKWCCVNHHCFDVDTRILGTGLVYFFGFIGGTEKDLRASDCVIDTRTQNINYHYKAHTQQIGKIRS